MKKQIYVLLIAAMVVAPVSSFSSSHGGMDMDHGSSMPMDKGEKMDHNMEKMDHGEKMQMDGMEMIMLQDEEVEGVMGSAHLMDTKEKMAKHGMSMTHHLMIGFMDSEGNGLDEGKVAVKVESPDGKIGDPIMMMGMDGQFGADVTLDKKGMYHFKIGSKLADGKKRTFHMHYENK